jgi:hypothetical protein
MRRRRRRQADRWRAAVGWAASSVAVYGPLMGHPYFPVLGRAARRAVMETHARPGGPGRASPSTLSSVPGRAWAGPKTRAFGRATGSRAIWTSITEPDLKDWSAASA